ncbi:MAG: hypothetical protein COB50_04545 [Thiotrichales bacterium]|nr:MAG: hypothetical protein COB50_04545 [Thiotrichales bacterium]
MSSSKYDLDVKENKDTISKKRPKYNNTTPLIHQSTESKNKQGSMDSILHTLMDDLKNNFYPLNKHFSSVGITKRVRLGVTKKLPVICSNYNEIVNTTGEIPKFLLTSKDKIAYLKAEWLNNLLKKNDGKSIETYHSAYFMHTNANKKNLAKKES